MKTNKPDLKNSPVVWFSIMEIEANRGNFERAAEAKRELERLGIFIRFKGAIQRKYKKVVEQQTPDFTELATQLTKII